MGGHGVGGGAHVEKELDVDGLKQLSVVGVGHTSTTGSAAAVTPARRSGTAHELQPSWTARAGAEAEAHHHARMGGERE
jgi:hypothetical protein